jgi:hypothetical protein
MAFRSRKIWTTNLRSGSANELARNPIIRGAVKPRPLGRGYKAHFSYEVWPLKPEQSTGYAFATVDQRRDRVFWRVVTSK